jgi:hypothetical protein
MDASADLPISKSARLGFDSAISKCIHPSFQTKNSPPSGHSIRAGNGIRLMINASVFYAIAQ